jgi:hypothetical protein
LRWQFRVDGRTVEVTPECAVSVDASDGVATVLAAGGRIGVSASYIAAPYVARGELVPILTSFRWNVLPSPRYGRKAGVPIRA